MTTEANGIDEPVHEKAMSVLRMTREDVDRWLSLEDAQAPQCPVPDEALVVWPPMKPEKKAALRSGGIRLLSRASHNLPIR